MTYVLIASGCAATCAVMTALSFRLTQTYDKLAHAYDLVVDMLEAPDRETQSRLADAEISRLGPKPHGR